MLKQICSKIPLLAGGILSILTEVTAEDNTILANTRSDILLGIFGEL